MPEMRAARYDRFGPPEVLYEGTAPVPLLEPGYVLIRVDANSVNGGELWVRAGRVKRATGAKFPKFIGVDFVGQVEAVDAAASGVAIGDHVWGSLPRDQYIRGQRGAAAELVAVHPRQISRSPQGLDPLEAAALPSGTTAITALRDKARLQPGESLLVRGASGGIGIVAVQLGRHYGAEVTALAGAGNLDRVRELGAHHVLDYRTTALRDLGRFDVVLDTVGTELKALRSLLSPGGRMVTITVDPAKIFSSMAYIAGSMIHGSRRVRFFSGAPKHELFADMTSLVEQGAVRPVVAAVYPLASIADAHRALEKGGSCGKHIINIRAVAGEQPAGRLSS